LTSHRLSDSDSGFLTGDWVLGTFLSPWPLPPCLGQNLFIIFSCFADLALSPDFPHFPSPSYFFHQFFMAFFFWREQQLVYRLYEAQIMQGPSQFEVYNLEKSVLPKRRTCLRRGEIGITNSDQWSLILRQADIHRPWVWWSDPYLPVRHHD